MNWERKNFNEERKREKGITLVALVITIIILLILAGVTINIIINGGLIKQAQNATDIYKQAQGEEINGIDNIVGKMNDIIGGNQSNPEDSLATKAQPGDYVRYEVPEKTFTMTTEQTGYTSEQTYNTGDYTGLWQVLYNDAEHGLQIISANDVTNGKDLYLKGKEGYNKSVGTLNSFCSNYVNETYATSGRCVGSNPIHPEGTTELYEGKYDYLKQYANDLISGDTECEADYNALKGATHQNTNGIWNINKTYWLASRYITTNPGITYFNVYCISVYSSVSYNILWSVQSSGSTGSLSDNNAVRVVITLKSGIKTSNGTGERESPYELVQ